MTIAMLSLILHFADWLKKKRMNGAQRWRREYLVFDTRIYDSPRLLRRPPVLHMSSPFIGYPFWTPTQLGTQGMGKGLDTISTFALVLSPSAELNKKKRKRKNRRQCIQIEMRQICARKITGSLIISKREEQF